VSVSALAEQCRRCRISPTQIPRGTALSTGRKHRHNRYRHRVNYPCLFAAVGGFLRQGLPASTTRFVKYLGDKWFENRRFSSSRESVALSDDPEASPFSPCRPEMDGWTQANLIPLGLPLVRSAGINTRTFGTPVRVGDSTTTRQHLSHLP
jgi:hypothetical protein